MDDSDPEYKSPNDLDLKAIDEAIQAAKKEFPLIPPTIVPPTIVPFDVLEGALARASLPPYIRKVGCFTIDIVEVVADLKATRELQKSPSVHWPRLQQLLSQIFADEDWAAIDEFVEAWDKVKPKPCNQVMGGQDFPFSELSDENDRMRLPLGWFVVKCVGEAQRDLGRIPFRSEILEYVTFYRPDEGIDDSELSRQLKNLGLAQWIPHQRSKSSKLTASPDSDAEE